MEPYGVVLKKLIKFTGLKLTTIADIAGYDVSYISKWCNQSKLPAARVAVTINDALAEVFAKEVLEQDGFEEFCAKFEAQIPIQELEALIGSMLKDAFKRTYDAKDKQTVQKTEENAKVFVNQSEILNFFDNEFRQAVFNSKEPVEVICTINILALSKTYFQAVDCEDLKPKSPVHVKIGLNFDELDTKNLLDLYKIINKYHHVSFDFYNNATFKNMNLCVVKNKFSVLCAMGNHGKIEVLSLISEPEKIASIFRRTTSLFKIHHMLITAMSSEELFTSGYRSNFYAFSDYQIYLAKGFEYLLPPALIDNIVKAAYQQGYDDSTEKMLRKLSVSWEELFSKESAEFFMLKSDLIHYIEDGEFYFTDIVYHMTPDERKQHIEHVLEVAEKNPKLKFYIIDDENMSYSSKAAIFSFYSNGSKQFFKNTRRFCDSRGPQFYSVLSEKLIEKICESVNALKELDICYYFPASSLDDFMKKYSSMIDRIISLSEINNPY